MRGVSPSTAPVTLPSTTSAPSAASSSPRPGSRTMAVTRSPRSRSWRTSDRPMKPEPPVTNTRLIAAAVGSLAPFPASVTRSVDRGVRTDALEPGLDVRDEAADLGAVGRPMVEGHRDVHDRADGYDIAVGGPTHDRALDDRLHVHDDDLGGVDDRLAGHRAEPARVVDGDRAALQVRQLQSIRPSPAGDVQDGAVQAGDESWSAS